MIELDVAIEDITPNEWNPNELDADSYRVLKESIQNNGFLQRVLVRKKATLDGRYEIIDGYHRFKCLKELGVKTVACLVEEHTDAEAMVLTLTMNRFRGNLNAVKLSKLFVTLSETYSISELSSKLGYSEDYVSNVLNLDTLDSSLVSSLEVGDDDPDKLYSSVFFLKNDEYLTVQEALTKRGGKEVEALLGVLNWYESLTT